MDQAKARILTLKNPSGYVPVQEFNALKQRLDERDADDLVELALKQGKIAPASADWLKQYAPQGPLRCKGVRRLGSQVVPVGTELAGGKRSRRPQVKSTTFKRRSISSWVSATRPSKSGKGAVSDGTDQGSQHAAA